MSGSGHQKRSDALSLRCYKLRKEGYTLGEIADITGLDKDKVSGRIKLGERLTSLND